MVVEVVPRRWEVQHVQGEALLMREERKSEEHGWEEVEGQKPGVCHLGMEVARQTLALFLARPPPGFWAVAVVVEDPDL